ncbi:MAG: hypothetical protein U0457_12590 [Candidatus Sericytochromatia bacterium]
MLENLISSTFEDDTKDIFDNISLKILTEYERQEDSIFDLVKLKQYNKLEIRN